MKQNKSIWQKLKDKRLTIGMSAMLGLSVVGGWLRSAYSAIKTEKKNEVAIKDTTNNATGVKVKNPVYDVKYQTDTLEQATSVLLFYSRGLITRYYVEKNNSFRMQMPYFAHEEWHHHNDDIHYRTHFYYTPLEYYKLCMHDEISANIAALLTARYEYLAAPTKAKRKEISDRYKSTYLKFYFEAIEKGKVNPLSKKKDDFEAEMEFIANGTQEMWMRKFSGTYSSRTYRMLQNYVARCGLIEDSRKNYNFVLNYMYTIGGVNFAKYMKKDINTADDKVKLAEQLRKVKSMRNGGLEIMNYVNNSYNLMRKVSFENTQNAFQNLLISAQLKYALRNKTPEELRQNPQLVNLCFVKVMNKVRADKSFEKAVLQYPVIAEGRVNLNYSEGADDEIIRQMYEFKGVDLRSLIAGYEREAMPVSVHKRKMMFENHAVDYISAALPEDLDEPTGAKSLAEAPQKHISKVMHLPIPNFREPILTAATGDDYFKILQCVREFEQIPQVLKYCDTEAQQRYFKEHPEAVQKYGQNSK